MTAGGFIAAAPVTIGKLKPKTPQLKNLVNAKMFQMTCTFS